MLTQDTSDMKLSAYPVGNWYFGLGLNGGGARRYPYSFDMSVNPLTLGDFNTAATRASRHKMGDVWASALWAAFARRGMGLSASDGGSASATSVTEAFDVPGTITGTVFRDDDGNGFKNGPDAGLAGWTVYRDLNSNGVLDLPTATTFNSTDTSKTITDGGANQLSTFTTSGLVGTIDSLVATITLTITPVGDTPQVSSITTSEDTLSRTSSSGCWIAALILDSGRRVGGIPALHSHRRRQLHIRTARGHGLARSRGAVSTQLAEATESSSVLLETPRIELSRSGVAAHPESASRWSSGRGRVPDT